MTADFCDVPTPPTPPPPPSTRTRLNPRPCLPCRPRTDLQRHHRRRADDREVAKAQHGHQTPRREAGDALLAVLPGVAVLALGAQDPGEVVPAGARRRVPAARGRAQGARDKQMRVVVDPPVIVVREDLGACEPAQRGRPGLAARLDGRTDDPPTPSHN